MPLCSSINGKFKATFTAYKKNKKPLAFSYILCKEGGKYEETRIECVQ